MKNIWRQTIAGEARKPVVSGIDFYAKDFIIYKSLLSDRKLACTTWRNTIIQNGVGFKRQWRRLLPSPDKEMVDVDGAGLVRAPAPQRILDADIECPGEVARQFKGLVATVIVVGGYGKHVGKVSVVSGIGKDQRVAV